MGGGRGGSDIAPPWQDVKYPEECVDDDDDVVTSNATDDAARATTSSTSTSTFLPTEEVLRRIDDEMHSFAAYVKLTTAERNARCIFVEHVAELCRMEFQKKGGGEEGGWRSRPR